LGRYKPSSSTIKELLGVFNLANSAGHEIVAQKAPNLTDLLNGLKEREIKSSFVFLGDAELPFKREREGETGSNWAATL